MRFRRSLSFPLLLSVLLFVGCTEAEGPSPPTASDSTLTPIERSKIDVDFRRLMRDSVKEADVSIVEREDGTRAYMVRIVTSDVEALRKAGVPTDSAIGGTVWTPLTLSEIRGLARMDAVTGLRADNEVPVSE